MAFTYVLSTDVGKVRMLIGDTDATDVQLQDDEIQALLDLNFGALYAACASACQTLASKAALSFTQVGLGSLSLNDKDKVAALKDASLRFKALDEEAPAFAIAEENLSDFNALTIIKNYVLRTEA